MNERRAITGAVVAASAALALGCSILVNTADLTGGLVDASEDGMPGDAASDADSAFGGDSPTADAGAGDSRVGDADTGDADAGCAPDATMTCAKLGVCCPAPAPYCRLKIDFKGASWSYECAAAPDLRQIGDPCAPDGGQCADGLSCGLVYPLTTEFVCVPLCFTSSECPSATPYCTRELSPSTAVKQCSTCDPVFPSACNGATCSVFTATAAPTCTSPGNVAIGGACVFESDCATQLLCICPPTGTATGIGNDCQSVDGGGACLRACHPFDVGSPCPTGGTCRLVAGTDYGYCG